MLLLPGLGGANKSRAAEIVVTCKSQRFDLTRRCPSAPGGRTRRSSSPRSPTLSELTLSVPTSLLGRGDGSRDKREGASERDREDAKTQSNKSRQRYKQVQIGEKRTHVRVWSLVQLFKY